MGKPKEYDPSADSEAKNHLDVSKWTPEERDLARRLFDKARSVEPIGISYEPTSEAEVSAAEDDQDGK